MARERPKIEVDGAAPGRGFLATVLRLAVAWPLAIVYWILRLIAWTVGSAVDRLTGGPERRSRR